MKAQRPPMGWNSWDSYLTTITEKDVLANAEYLRDHLLPFGWDTVVVDASWFDPNARSAGYNDPDKGARFCLDGYGRQVPAPDRFPSAANGKGFGPLADRIHAMGLRFGFHVMRGIPRQAVRENLPVKGTQYRAQDVADTDPEHLCRWNSDNFGLDHAHPGAQAWYDAQVDLFASWGADFLKVDDMQAPFYPDEIAAYRAAIRTAELKYGRPITLSLSPGTQVATTHVGFLRAHAEMWRISDDLWDKWSDVHAQFARLARWAPLQRRGHWADADMLPLGHLTVNDGNGGHQSNLTHDEQKTLLTLWVMAHSPLMMGGDLPTSEPACLRLLENPWLERVEATAAPGREVVREPYSREDNFDGWTGKEIPEGEFIVWAADAGDAPGSHYAALFWTGPTPADQDVDLAAVVGLDGIDGVRRPAWTVTDLWAGSESGSDDSASDRPVFDSDVRIEGRKLYARIPSHGVVWLRLDPRG